MNAITPTSMPIHDMQTLALAIAKSGLFGIKTPDQALVLMAIAQAEGRHPVEAARDYDIIQGRPAKKAEAMMRDFIQAGGKVEWHELSDQRADATFTHPQTGSVRIDWDMARAVTAFGKKEMYGKFPRQMLRSRVVSEGVRTLWPLATSGMYVEDEVAAMPAKPEHNGTTLEGKAETPEPGTRDAVNAEVKLKAAAADMPRSERIVDKAEVYDTKPRTPREFLDALAIALRDAQDAEEADRILCRDDVLKAKETFTGAAKTLLDGLIIDSLRKWTPAEEPDLSDEELGDVEIEGAEKVGA